MDTLYSLLNFQRNNKKRGNRLALPASADAAQESSYYEQTRDFYERLAASYDYLYPDHLRYSNHLFTQLQPLLRQHGVNRILDASCGVGHDIACLSQLGFQVDGVDVSPAMVAEARKRLELAGINGGELKVGDVRELAHCTPGEQYDLVVFRGNTLSNIHPADMKQAISQLASALRPGGLLLLDYRDGAEQLSTGKRYEPRGRGYDRVTHTAFWSFYLLKNSGSLREPYEVNSIIMRVNFKDGLNFEHFRIRSHYVDLTLLTDAFEELSLAQTPFPHVAEGGLPYLTTLLLQRRT